ncbi:MAG TPA: sodium:solute symporter family protein [bacterium]|nr:sodium:solute symporter family protein [bacterium]
MQLNEAVKSVFASGNFTSLDWGIVVIYLLASLIIGVFSNRFIKGISGYIIAGRSLGTALAVATMTGTELGLITVMYSAQKGFTGGFAAFHIAVICLIVTFFVGLSGFIVARLRESQVMTIPEYYEQRFGRRTRILGGILLAFGGILNMGLFLKVGSMFVVGVTGMDPTGGLLTAVMVTLIALVLAYTILGGMVSVVVTDYFQFVVLSFGMLLMVGLTLNRFGWDQMVDVVFQFKGRGGFDPTVSEGGFGFTYMSWQAVLGLVSCAIWPTAVTRALSSRDVKTVKRQYMLSSLSFMIRFMIPYFLGIGAFVFVMTSGGLYKEIFFPEDPSQAVNNLYAMPLFVSHVVPTGLLGLVTAAMLAAFMSTHDSYLLCWSSVITLDIISPLRHRKPITDKGKILLTRVIMLLIGAYIVFWGLFYEGSEDIWDYMGITGAIYFTGAISLLLFGLYWKRASSTGAVLSLLGGFSAVLGLGKVRLWLGGLLGMELTPAHVGLFSLFLSMGAMVLGSLLFPDKQRQSVTEAE